MNVSWLQTKRFRSDAAVTSPGYGRCASGGHPCLGIAKIPRKRVARSLDGDELVRLGRVLDARQAGRSDAVAAIRLLALTGCRHSDVLDSRGRDIGGDALNLPASKTGPRDGARRGRSSRRCPACAIRRHSWFRDTP